MNLLLLAGGAAGLLLVALIWLARENGRIRKERNDLRAVINAKDAQLRKAIDARPGDGLKRMRDGTF